MTDRRIEVVSLIDVPARAVIPGDTLCEDRYSLGPRRSYVVTRVLRFGVGNELVNVSGQLWNLRLGVDEVMTVRRRVVFDREYLVMLVDDASRSAGHCDENLSGEWVASLLEGKRVEL